MYRVAIFLTKTNSIDSKAMKPYIVGLFCLFLSAQLYAQKTIEYQCYDIDAVLPVSLTVTLSSEPMEYFGQSFYILKYDLKIGTLLNHSFYTYKFNRKLYLLDQGATSLNYTKDQVLFDINQEERMLNKVSGIFDNVDLTLDDKLVINDKEFYYYNAGDINFSYFTISQMVFDKNLDINQIEVKSYIGTTQCVLKNIVISLPEKQKNNGIGKTKTKQGQKDSPVDDVRIKSNWDKK